jgi:predicted TIM-barrel fold metal-dependent hydrolase
MSNVIADSASPLKLIDFHNHYVGPSLTLTTLAGVPPAQRAFWEGVNRSLADPVALISSIEGNGIAARVISTPLEFLQDAYSGDAGARELARAVKELGLRGVFVESAKGDLLPDAKEAQPTFVAAATLGVPVFMHPVEDPQLFKRFKPYGRLGVRLTRGTINSAALFAVLESGMFEEMPNLRIVVTALALGGLLLAGGVGDGAHLRKDAPASARRHVYADTTGLHPVTVRSATDLLGADHVLLGTDWPVVAESAERIRSVLTACGLDVEEQRMIASGNTLKLLGVG